MGEDFFQDEIVITSGNRVISKDKLPPTTRRLITHWLTTPTFEMFTSPNIKIDDVKRRIFNLIDRAVQRAKEEILSLEDSSIFEVLDKIGITKE